jgi:hypothetical protein
MFGIGAHWLTGFNGRVKLTLVDWRRNATEGGELFSFRQMPCFKLMCLPTGVDSMRTRASR